MKKSEYIRCEECGGFIDKGSCCCALREEILVSLSNKIGISKDRVIEMLENGEITWTNYHHGQVDNDIITTHEYTYSKEAN